jgi:hypothetical protein
MSLEAFQHLGTMAADAAGAGEKDLCCIVAKRVHPAISCLGALRTPAMERVIRLSLPASENSQTWDEPTTPLTASPRSLDGCGDWMLQPKQIC